jgi:hypothetical protein
MQQVTPHCIRYSAHVVGRLTTAQKFDMASKPESSIRLPKLSPRSTLEALLYTILSGMSRPHGVWPPRHAGGAASRRERKVAVAEARWGTKGRSQGLRARGAATRMPFECSVPLRLADNLTRQGRYRKAREIFERLLGLCNDVGLLSEEYDPATDRLVGNFPPGILACGVDQHGAEPVASWRPGRKAAEPLSAPSSSRRGLPDIWAVRAIKQRSENMTVEANPDWLKLDNAAKIYPGRIIARRTGRLPALDHLRQADPHRGTAAGVCQRLGQVSILPGVFEAGCFLVLFAKTQSDPSDPASG